MFNIITIGGEIRNKDFMVTCITDARMATLTRRERLRELGVMTASGTGTGTGIQPWIWVQCSPIPARRIFLCYGWDSGPIWPFKPSPDVRMKVETVDWHLKALFLFFCIYQYIYSHSLLTSVSWQSDSHP